MPGRLDGKVALITGGGSGFGASIARHFAQEGAHIFIGDINLEGANEIASEFSTVQVVTGKLNVTSRTDRAAAVSKIKQEFSGKLDIFVNNAGTILNIVYLRYKILRRKVRTVRVMAMIKQFISEVRVDETSYLWPVHPNKKLEILAS